MRFPDREYVGGTEDIFDRVDVDVFSFFDLDQMVLQLGYTGHNEPLFYHYLSPMSTLDHDMFPLSSDDDVRCLGYLVTGFKLIEVYIEHGCSRVTGKTRVIIEELGSSPPSASKVTKPRQMLALTWPDNTDNVALPAKSTQGTHFTQLNLSECGENQNNDLPHIDSQFGSLNLSFTPGVPASKEAVSKKLVDIVRMMEFVDINNV
jgi:hypothetical protein